MGAGLDEDDRESLARHAPLGVLDRHPSVGEPACIDRRHRRLDGVVHPIQLCRAHVTLEGGDVRLVGGIEGEAVRDTFAHARIPCAGVLEGDLVGVDQHVDRGQAAHARSLPKIEFQSSFMLTTVQPSSPAMRNADSAPDL